MSNSLLDIIHIDYKIVICYHAVMDSRQNSIIGDFKLPRGSETVLVVDDDDNVRKIVVEILQTLGYAVLESNAPKKALEISRNYTGQIHLLLTDVAMPELNGKELAHAFAAVRPETKILYMSGDPDIFNPSLFLQKPFSSSALASKIRAVLDK